MFRGRADATIDGKGRLKVPARFRDLLREHCGGRVFVTCLSSHGECAHVYPMPVWERIERGLALVPITEPALQPIQDAASYFGLEYAMDGDGRILVPPFLRESAGLSQGAESIVLGKNYYIEIWNHQNFRARLTQHPVTDELRLRLAQYKILPMPEEEGGGASRE
jgi:MraZ protein